MSMLLDDQNLISTRDASRLSGYHSDYLGRLCREGKIIGSRIGRAWIIDRASLEAFVSDQERAKKENAAALALAREQEYQAAQRKAVMPEPVPAAPVRSPYAPVPTPYRERPLRDRAVAGLVAAASVSLGLAFASAGAVESLAHLSVRAAGMATEAGYGALGDAGSAILAFEERLGSAILGAAGSARGSYDGAVAAAGNAARSDDALGLAASAGAALHDPSPQRFAAALRDLQLALGNGVIGFSETVLGAHERAAYGWIRGSEEVPPRIIAALYGIGREYASVAARAPRALARGYDDAILAWVEETQRIAERTAATQVAFGSGMIRVASGEALTPARSALSRALDTRIAEPRMAAAAATSDANLLRPLRSLALFVYESFNRTAASFARSLAVIVAPVAPHIVRAPEGVSSTTGSSVTRSVTEVSRIVQNVTNTFVTSPVTYVYGGVTREYVRQALDNLRDDLRDNDDDDAVSLGDSSLEDLGDVGSMTKDWGDLLYWNGSSWADIATSSLGLAGGSGTPGGNDTEVQFNDGGAFGGSASFTFNTSTALLTVANIVSGNSTSTNATSTNSYALSMTAGSIAADELNVTGSGTIAYASSTVISAPTICLGTDCRMSWPTGGGAGGSISTSSPETAGYVPYWTTTGAAPAALGSDSGFQYNASADRLTIVNASSTALSSGYASTTRFGINGELFTDLTGTGLQNVGGALTINATGDWTGTFDGQEGSYYLANSFSTTSANYWQTTRDFFSTTSANYWETQQTARTADDLTNNSIEDLSDVAAMTENFGDLLGWNGSTWTDFATSSLGLPTFADLAGYATFAYPFPGNATTTTIAFNNGLLSVGSTTINGNATTTGQQGVGSLFINNELFTDLTGTGLQNVGGALTINATGDWTGTFDGLEGSAYLANAFSTTSAAYHLTTREKGFFFSTTSADYYVNASTTIPKTYTANTFTAAQVLSGGLTLGTLNGPLQANNGLVSATTSIGVLYGGTGLTTAPSYGQLLMGNGSGGYALTATSSLGLPTFADLAGYATFAYPFPNGATTSALGLYASTTIGNGTAAGALTVSGTATTTNLVISSIASGRVPYTTTGGAITSSSGMTFNGSTFTVTGDISVGTALVDGGGSSLDIGDSNDNINLSSGALYVQASNDFVGVGTTSPYAKLSVAGQAVAANFTATTSATSTFPTLASTIFGFGTDYFTDLTGTGLQVVAGALTLNATGDWTGTFDGQEGSYYLANSFSTTSANYWQTTRDFFSTTSANYWETQQTARTADDLTNNSIEDLSDVAAMTENFGDLLGWNGSTWTDFATSSLGLPTFSTLGSYFTLADWYATTTDGLDEGSANQYFTQARARQSISETITGVDYNNGTGVFSLTSGYTIPLTASTTEWATAYGWGDHSAAGYENALTFSYPLVRSTNTISLAFGTSTSNTWGGTQTFTNAPVLGSLTGVLYGNNGALAVKATSTATLGLGLSGTLTTLGSSDTLSVATSSLYTGTAGQVTYFDGTNSMTGTSSVFISTGGNVGVGTTNPQRKLQIQTSGTTASIALSSDSSNSAAVHFGTPSDLDIGRITYSNPGDALGFYTNNTERMSITTTGNVGIGTTSPYAKLSVVGQVVGSHFTATTSATSTFPYTSITGLGIGGDYLTDLVGTGLQVISGALSLNATGDWTGTFDGQEGAYYLANAFSTTSAQYFAHSSTTIPKTYTTNTFTAAQVLSGGLTLGSLNGPLQANAGVVSATTSIGVLYGGTGLTSAPAYGQVLVGNGSGGYTLTATSSLGISGSGGLASYDAWTHPAAGQSATTSLMLFNGGASSTQLSATQAYFGGTATSTFTSAGYLGIGSSSPILPLSIQGNGTYGGFQYSAALSTANTNGAGILFTGNGTYDGRNWQLVALGGGNTSLGSAGGFSITDRTANASRMTFDTSGNVAIGTTTPLAKLHVHNGNVAMSYGYRFLVSPERTDWTSGTTTLIGTNWNGTTDSVQFSVPGSTSMGPVLTLIADAVTETGKVGIGTSTPSSRLQVYGPGLSLLRLESSSGEGAMDFYEGSTVRGYFGFGDAGDIFSSGVSDTMRLRAESGIHLGVGDNPQHLTIHSSGNVGIGTTTPQWLLNPMSSSAAQLSLSAGPGVAQWAFRNAGGNLYFATTTIAGTATSTVSALTILNTNGSVGIGTSSPFAHLSVAAGSAAYNIFSEGEILSTANNSNVAGFSGYATIGGMTHIYSIGRDTNGMRLNSLDDFKFFTGASSYTGGTERLRITSAGNVGIGTTTPLNKLSIVTSFGINTNDGLLITDGQGGSNLAAVGLKLKSDAAGSYRGAIDAIGGATTFEALSISPYTGYVGIGTTTPGVRLGVFGGGGTGGLSVAGTVAGLTTANAFYADNNSGDSRLISVGANTSTNGSFSFVRSGLSATGFTTSMKIDTSGLVGIGTTTPIDLLSIYTSATAGGINMGVWDSLRNGITLNGQDASSAGSYNILSGLGDPNLYLNRPSGSNIKFREANGGTDQLTILTGGSSIVPDGNFSVCTGGACPTGSPSGNGNLIAETAIGIASSTPWAGLSLASGKAIVVGENTLATSTSMTVDWRNGNQQLIRIGGSATTISFSGFVDGQKLVLTVCNPGSTAGAISWGTQVLWSGGTAPTQTTTANKCDVWSFLATRATSTLKIFGTQSANF